MFWKDLEKHFGDKLYISSNGMERPPTINRNTYKKLNMGGI